MLESRHSASGSAAGPDASVLFPPGRDIDAPDRVDEPSYFRDVNLDQIVAGVVLGRSRYNLTALFRARVHDLDTIAWRHAVFRDLERPHVKDVVVDFARRLDATRKHFQPADQFGGHQQRLLRTLNGLASYIDAVEQFADAITAAEPGSGGLAGLADHVRTYRADPVFTEFASGTRDLIEQLAAIRYDLLIRGPKITVGNYEEEADYGARVLSTFERFRQGEVADHHVRVRKGEQLDSIEVAILGLVAQLHPELFGQLEAFCSRHTDFLDPTIVRAERDLQFYLAWLDHLAPIRRAGLDVCYPRMSAHDKTLIASSTFDLALADKLAGSDTRIVTNDLMLTGEERILVVSGPNQGGKTTLARTFGQLYHLASLGCPVPGADVSLHLSDAIYSHFEREEQLETLSGKLEGDVTRVHDILTSATSNSVVILNEMFNSTTVADAHILSERVLETISGLDAVCLCVTFIDELSLLDAKTVSVVATVDTDDPRVRTFKVIRRPADGHAYALAIADKYQLTFATLRDRLESNG